MSGKLVISLDFELHWGSAEKWDIEVKSDYFLNTRNSIPIVLSLFEENSIKATWATVGFLFAKNRDQLMQFLPVIRPSYTQSALSAYNYLDLVGNDEESDPFHFAHSLIQSILKTRGQELATHTFSHYYCNENGQTPEQFREDLCAAQAIAKLNFGIQLRSLVFPRNQYNSAYLKIAKEQGICVVRSNPDVWFWRRGGSKFFSFFRAADTLFSISNSLSFNADNILREVLVELPSSRFFRSYKDNERLIQGIKIRRIKKEMLHAAQNNLVYHLWWHPHNFGDNVGENLIQLEELINYFKTLRSKYDFESAAMIDFL